MQLTNEWPYLICLSQADICVLSLSMLCDRSVLLIAQTSRYFLDSRIIDFVTTFLADESLTTSVQFAS